VKGHLFWIAVWLGVILAGYLLTDHLIAPPPVVRALATGNQEIVVPVARDGHYYLDGAINGTPVRFMVDTGASYVSIGEELALKAGLRGGISGYFSTANGTVEGRVVKNNRVRADALEISGLSVAVMPQQAGEALLGLPAPFRGAAIRRHAASAHARRWRGREPSPGLILSPREFRRPARRTP
jgi:aspartyl protease family protein